MLKLAVLKHIKLGALGPGLHLGVGQAAETDRLFEKTAQLCGI